MIRSGFASHAFKLSPLLAVAAALAWLASCDEFDPQLYKNAQNATGGAGGGTAGAGGDDAGVPGAVVEISAGHFHTCARRENGSVWCWGNNEEGQIGDGKDPAGEPVVHTATPVVLASDGTQLSNVTQISCGEADNCALQKGGAVVCWGANDEGQLGIGTTQAQPGAVPVIGINEGNIAIQAAAGDAFNCAVMLSGRVNCWGLNNVGQLGNGSSDPGSPIPVQVTGINDAVQMSIGESHACAVESTGLVKCWGNNDFDQLGMGEIGGDAGPPAFSNVPVEVVGLKNAKFVELGEKHSCAWLNTNELFCWGNNNAGQLGGGATGGTSPTPVKVVNLNVPKGVSGAGDHTCGYLENGAAYCWGTNGYGELGAPPGAVTGSPNPIQVGGVSGVKAVTVGNEHSCAFTTTQEVFCWGHNTQGQLGDGMAEELSATPIKVPGFE